jgi:peptidyl-prolyl cis-trans isomerase A (cyclophilin A)
VRPGLRSVFRARPGAIPTLTSEPGANILGAMKSLLLSVAAAVLFTGASAFSQQANPSDPVVLLKTSAGDIKIELFPDKAPKTVANFLSYVKSGQYNATIFHRVIPGFMVQGGGFTADMAQKPTGAPIPLESQNGLKNEIGTVAMARTSDPKSATDQFFINTADNAFLNYPGQDGAGYAVFGKVIDGLPVVKKIEQAPTTDKGGMQDVPATPIVIESATVVSK